MLDRSRPQAPTFARWLLTGMFILLLLPLTMMIFTSFIHLTADSTVEITFRYWLEVFEDMPLRDSLINSLIVASSASAVAVVLGSLAALALAKTPFFGRTFLRLSSVISLVFPEIVFALSLLSLFFVLGIQLGLWTVIIAHISFSLPYVILTVGARASSLDRSIDDAAKDLGASDFILLTRIHLPLLKPAIISSFFLAFLLSFDDFLITYFVNGVGYDTLPIKLYTSMKTGITPKLNALATMIFLSTSVILFLLFRSPALNKTLDDLNKSENL